MNVPPINTVIRASNALAIATPEVRRSPLANGVVIDVSKLPDPHDLIQQAAQTRTEEQEVKRH